MSGGTVRIWAPLAAVVLAPALSPRTAELRAQIDAMPFVPDAAADDGPVLFQRAPLHTDGRYIVINVADNHLFVMEGRRAIWSAPVATGTGFRLQGGDREWHFSTPRGVFRVQRKEKDPIWIKPDWAFIEQGLPVPPLNSPLRRQRGMLGTTALYIGYELAIHGTSNPELVLRSDPEERRVSHGCIRLTNEDARILYYLVDVGTPVLIY